MCILLETYAYSIVPFGQKENFEELEILAYNKYEEFIQVLKEKKKINEISPEAKAYIKKVTNYSNRVQVYLCDAKTYHFPGGDPTQPSGTLY